VSLLELPEAGFQFVNSGILPVIAPAFRLPELV